MLYDIYFSLPLLREYEYVYTLNWLIFLPFFSDLVIFAWICATLTALSIIIEPDDGDDEERKRKQKHKEEAMHKFFYVTGVMIAVLGFAAISQSPGFLFKFVDPNQMHVISDVVISNVGDIVDGTVSGLDFDAIDYDNLEIYSIKELSQILVAFSDGTILENHWNYHKVFMQLIKLKGSLL